MLGESPVRQDEQQGKPFVGELGEFIKTRVANRGLFGKVFWANAARCRIDKKELSQKEITAALKLCRPNVEKVLRVLRPKVVFLMGGFALKQVLKKGGVKTHRGKWYWSEDFQCWCIATWHPGYIFRSRAHEPEFDEDFNKLVEFVENGYSPPKDTQERQYLEVDSIQDILDRADQERLICSFDTEGQGLDWVSSNFIPISYSISWETGKAYHVQLYKEVDTEKKADLVIQWPRKTGKRKKEEVPVYVAKCKNFKKRLAELKSFTQHPNILKVMQHGSFDQHVVDKLFTMNGLPRPTWERYIADIQALAHVLDENLYVMANLTKLQYAFTSVKEDYNTHFDTTYDKSDMLAVPHDELVKYAGYDVDVTRQAFMGIWKRVKKTPSLIKYYKTFVHPALTKLIYSLEHFGVAVNLEELPNATAEVKAIRDMHENNVLELLPKKVKLAHAEKGLKLTRRDIIRDTFFSENGYNFKPIKLTDNKQPSVDKDTLKELNSLTKNKKIKTLIYEYQQFSEYDMLWSRYLKGYAKHIREDGRTHSSISITAAATGRLGTREPNNMAIPKRSKAAPIVRRLIVPAPGYKFVLIDQSQSELRLLAHYSQDPDMIAVFKNGDDIHTVTAQEIVRMTGKRWKDLSKEEQKDMRTKAKPVNFGVIYLMSPPGLVRYAKSDYGLDMTLDQAKMWMSALFNRYKRIKPYQQKMIDFARKHGYVETMLGRRRRLPEINSNDDFLRFEAERQAVNQPIQGASSDMVILAGNTIIDKGFPESEIRPVLFIHDELIFEVIENKIDYYVPHIVTAMEHPPLERFGVKLRVPLLAEPKIGDNASDTKNYIKDCNSIAKGGKHGS